MSGIESFKGLLRAQLYDFRSNGPAKQPELVFEMCESHVSF